MREAAKLAKAVGLAGGAAVKADQSKRNRRRALRAGRPPESINDILKDNQELTEMIQQLSMKQLWYERDSCRDKELKHQLQQYDTAEDFMHSNWDCREVAQQSITNDLKSQDIPCKEMRNKTQNFHEDVEQQAATDGGYERKRCPTCSTRGDFIRFDDIHQRRSTRHHTMDNEKKQAVKRLKLLGYEQHRKINPLTSKLPGDRRNRDIHTCFIDQDGHVWDRLDINADRFQIINPDKDFARIKRRITVDRTTGQILQDAYFNDGYINVAYQFGFQHPINAQLQYEKDNIVLGLERTYATNPKATNQSAENTTTVEHEYPALEQHYRKIDDGTTPKGEISQDDTDFHDAMELHGEEIEKQLGEQRAEILRTIVNKGLIDSIELPAAPIPTWAMVVNNSSKRRDEDWMRTVGEQEYTCAVVNREEPIHERLLIEYCCGPDSFISTPCKWTTGCKMIRLTEKEDMASEEGLMHALEMLKKDHAAQKGRVMLWAAMPCTGGSAWNRYNWTQNYYHNIRDTIKRHWTLSRKLFSNFKILAEQVLKLGGCVVNEWPKSCEYWTDKSIRKFFTRHGFEYTDFDGCCYDLKLLSKDTRRIQS